METERLKILAIDDNPDNLTAVKAVVADAFPAALTLTALNGRRGIELARAEDPDVILLDIVMPEMDGFEVCRRLKNDNSLSHIPVIFLTALRNDQESHVKALEAGAEAFLAKPIEVAELTAQIRAMAKVKAGHVLQHMVTERLATMVAERTVELSRELAERKRAEERFQSLFNEMLDGFALHEIICDDAGQPADYRFLAVNPAFERLTGLKGEAIVGRTALEVIPGLERHWIETYGRVALSGVPTIFEHESRELKKYYHVTAYQPAPGQFACIFSDVTEIWHARNQRELTAELLGLLNQENSLHELIRQTTGLLAKWSDCEAVGVRLREGDDFPYFETRGFPPEFVECERHLCPRDPAGLPVGDAQGNPAPECMCRNTLCGRFDPKLPFFTPHGSFWSNATTKLPACTRTRCNGEGYASVALVPLRHGSATLGLLQFNARAAGRFTPERIEFLEGCADQIAIALAQRQAHAGLRESEDKYRTLFETMKQGVFYQRADGTLIDANPAALAMLGLTREEFLARDSSHAAWDVIRADGTPLPGMEHPSMVALTTGQVVREAVAGVFNPHTRSRVWLQIDAVPWFRPGDPKPFQVVVTMHDVTERRRAREEHEKLQDQLAQAQKMESVGRLAGGVAHDLNNMITPILGYGEMLLEDFAGDARRREELGEIVQAAERARDLVHQLLAFARKQPIEVKPLDLRQVLTGFEKMLRRTLRENIRIEVAGGGDPCFMMGDTGQLTQVVLNLAVNAQDAMPAGGLLTLELGRVNLAAGEVAGTPQCPPGAYVMLSARDTGNGMDEATAQKVFEPFFTTKIAGRGTGLGLATVYGIVNQLGGFIRVAGNPGRGAEFRLYFPAIDDPGPALRLSQHRRDAGRGETILVVEDQESVRSLVCKILKKAGYKVHEHVSAEQALKFAASCPEPIHLLLTDVIMPGMNGRELNEQLATRCPGLRVLYMSGYTSDVLAQFNGLEMGAHFINKPFTIDALTAKVRQLLDAPARAV